MKLDRIALIVVLCLGASPALAQQSMPSTRNGSLPVSPLVKSCSALGSSTDCAIGLPNQTLQPHSASQNAPSQSNGSGLPSTFRLHPATGMGGDTLSRGISGGMTGSIGAAGPLGGGRMH
jgi:hypothetical protein